VTAGDGFLAMFDGPQRAIRCAMAIRDAVQSLGIQTASSSEAAALRSSSSSSTCRLPGCHRAGGSTT